jgi:hypothetical protein
MVDSVQLPGFDDDLSRPTAVRALHAASADVDAAADSDGYADTHADRCDALGYANADVDADSDGYAGTAHHANRRGANGNADATNGDAIVYAFTDRAATGYRDARAADAADLAVEHAWRVRVDDRSGRGI